MTLLIPRKPFMLRPLSLPTSPKCSPDPRMTLFISKQHAAIQKIGQLYIYMYVFQGTAPGCSLKVIKYNLVNWH